MHFVPSEFHYGATPSHFPPVRDIYHLNSAIYNEEINKNRFLELGLPCDVGPEFMTSPSHNHSYRSPN